MRMTQIKKQITAATVVLHTLLAGHSSFAAEQSYRGRSAQDGTPCEVTIYSEGVAITKIEYSGTGRTWQLFDFTKDGLNGPASSPYPMNDSVAVGEKPFKKSTFWFTEGYRFKAKLKQSDLRMASATVTLDVECANGAPQNLCAREKMYLFGFKVQQQELKCEQLVPVKK